MPDVRLCPFCQIVNGACTERADLMQLLNWAKADVHIHLILRYWEARVDPRGGVRWVVPGPADYWSKG